MIKLIIHPSQSIFTAIFKHENYSSIQSISLKEGKIQLLYKLEGIGVFDDIRYTPEADMLLLYVYGGPVLGIGGLYGFSLLKQKILIYLPFSLEGGGEDLFFLQWWLCNSFVSFLFLCCSRVLFPKSCGKRFES